MILIPLLYRAVNYPEQCRRHDKELQTFYSKIPSTDQNMTICENFVKSLRTHYAYCANFILFVLNFMQIVIDIYLPNVVQ